MGNEIGEAIRVGIGPGGLVDHEGIITGFDWDGVLLVTHASKRLGVVATERFEAFAGGRPVVRLGHLGHGDGAATARRALSAVGKPWNLFSRNCQHFSRWASGAPVESPQLQRATLAVLLLWLAKAA